MIVVTLGIRVTPQNKGHAVQVILPTLGPTRTEPGCVSCDLYQSTEDDMRLTVMEQWDSFANLERHIRSDRYRKILAWLEMSTEAPEIRFDTVSGSQGLEMIKTVRGRN